MRDDLSTLFNDSAHPAVGEPDAGPFRVSIEQYRPVNGDHLCSLWTDPATDRRTGRRYLDGAPAAGSLCIRRTTCTWRDSTSVPSACAVFG
jgi:hypothetical protein